MLRKDEGLDRLADSINVAQFVAFEPSGNGPLQTYSRILGDAPNGRYESADEAVTRLFARSGEGSVNVRSYLPDDPRSKEFVYGLKSVDAARATLRRISDEGLFTIVNETIDVGDGGVSGVVQGDVIEFAPDATPRAVESGSACSLPRELGLALLATVYRFRPEIDVPSTTRLEFSLHPKPRGWQNRHTVGWEIEEAVATPPPARFVWRNDFSRMIGDKAFGLLAAHYLGLRVPETHVIGRRIAPFIFGTPTGSPEVWIRTCPEEQQPGRFATVRGWVDPFELLASEDDDKEVASVLSQAAVASVWSGASQVLIDGALAIEGRHGDGATFMMGEVAGEAIPEFVEAAVRDVHESQATLGPVRTEWVHDGELLWIVQFHRGATNATRTVISTGHADHWLDFDPKDGLPALRSLLASIPSKTGLRLLRPVGLTSHVADIIRRTGIPAIFA